MSKPVDKLPDAKLTTELGLLAQQKSVAEKEIIRCTERENEINIELRKREGNPKSPNDQSTTFTPSTIQASAPNKNEDHTTGEWVSLRRQEIGSDENGPELPWAKD
jgi:hypothetical protein